MNVLKRSRRLAGCAALAAALAGIAVAGSPPAPARASWLTPSVQGAESWGDNRVGELGNGTGAGSALPGRVSGLASGVVQVSAGCTGQHGLALTSDGTVWAWGQNTYGQLGNGTLTNSTTPVQVTGLTGVIQVSAGATHSLALRSDGTVWAWGDNSFGELGNGVTISVPQSTPGVVAGLTGVTKISAGNGFSLALRSDGTVWAWGFNGDGELGNGTMTSSPVPVQVTGLSHVTSISAGDESSLATRTNGITTITSVWAWGNNFLGQLGDGTLTDHLTPEQVTGINTPYLASISAGFNFAVVLGTDGSVWGWGDDRSGQLGNSPASNPVTQPVQTIGTGSGITQLSAGLDHVLALESNGTVLAWGANYSGQLGDGSTASVTGSVQVSGLSTASQVSAGGGFSLAVVAFAVVPDLTGDTQAQASQALQAAGLVLGPVYTVVDSTCNNIGTVMSQSPAAGISVDFGSAVSVTIGKRPRICP